MSDTENAVELHVVSQDNEQVIDALERFCEQQGLRIIRVFYRNIEPEEWDILDSSN